MSPAAIWPIENGSSPRTEARPASFYTFDRETKKVKPLYDEHPALLRYALAPKKPIIIKARDGLELVSYLTTPPGVEAKNLPLVLLIHGGPWYRDRDNYDPEVQFSPTAVMRCCK